MNIRQFEELVTNRGLSPAKKRKVGDVYVFICDGRKPDGSYQTWYAIGKDTETLDVAQMLEFDEYEVVGGVLRRSTYLRREEAALEQAKETISNIKRTPLYGTH